MSSLDDRLATVEDAAEFFNTSAGALRVQRHRNISPGNLGVKVGARVLYSPDTMRSWFKAQEQAQAQAADTE